MRIRVPLMFTLVCSFGLMIAACATNALADTVLYDSHGFESPIFTAGGTPVGQDASNPWLAFGGSPAAFSVEAGVGVSGSQAIRGNGGGLNDGSFVWPNLGYTPAPNEKVRIQVDMARTLSDPVDDSSPVYAVDVYDEEFNRTTRFGLQNNNGAIRAFISVPIDGQGNIDPNGPGIRPEYYGAAIAPSAFVHFDFWMDYTAKTVTLYLNGDLLAENVPFRTPTSTFLDSAELQVGTFNNESADFGYFDNYVVSVAVPEPSSIALLLVGLGGLVAYGARSRRGRSAN